MPIAFTLWVLQLIPIFGWVDLAAQVNCIFFNYALLKQTPWSVHVIWAAVEYASNWITTAPWEIRYLANIFLTTSNSTGDMVSIMSATWPSRNYLYTHFKITSYPCVHEQYPNLWQSSALEVWHPPVTQATWFDSLCEFVQAIEGWYASPWSWIGR